MKFDSMRDYSNLQEKRVADFLGFKVVSGSGSDKFYPGDVTSASFLCECKTHTVVSDNVEFKHTWWEQICEEAQSVNKIPVLITDNGSQSVDQSWVVTKPFAIDFNHSDVRIDMYEFPVTSLEKSIAKVNVNFAFTPSFINNAIEQLSDSGTVIVFSVNWSGSELILLRLQDFREVMIK